MTAHKPTSRKSCVYPGCVSTDRHFHGPFPGGYENPSDLDGPPIPFTSDPAPGVRDYNGALLQPVPKPTMRVKEPRPLRSRPNPVNLRAKEATFRRDEFLCQWCRVPGGRLDPHHRLRRGQGGKDVPEHMVSVHRLCHSYIHDHPAEAAERGFLVTSEDELIRGWR